MRNGGRLLAGHSATRHRASVVGLVVAGLLLAGCSSDAPAAERAEATSSTTAESTTPDASDNGEPTTTSTSSTSTTSTTVAAHGFEPLIADPALTPDQQVEAAYLYHWEVLSYAGRTGDTSVLPLVFADEALELRSAQVAAQHESGRHVDGHVEHNYRVLLTEPGEAHVLDAYRTHLSIVDTASGAVIERGDGAELYYDFTLELKEGVWQITDVVEFRPTDSHQ